MKAVQLTALLASAAFAVSSASGQIAVTQANVFQESFGDLPDGTTITTENTDLTYVRVGTQGGSIQAQNPSSFDAGASLFLSGPSGGSLNGIGAFDLPSSEVYELAFDFRLANTDGTFVFGVGEGTSFTGNGTFNTNQGLFWLQVNGGELQRRTGSWVDLETLSTDTNYSIRVVANATESAIIYDSIAIASGSMSIFLNGSNIAEDVPVTTELSASAFRMYSVSGANYEIDNIAVAIPEPSTYAALFGALALGMVVFLRRRRR